MIMKEFIKRTIRPEAKPEIGAKHDEPQMREDLKTTYKIVKWMKEMNVESEVNWDELDRMYEIIMYEIEVLFYNLKQ